MTPELEEYFNNYNELFNHVGFKQLIGELTNNAKQLADIQTVKEATLRGLDESLKRGQYRDNFTV